MGGVVQILFWMLVVAIFAFAPLGYFIYVYMAKNGEPFGDTEPHGDSESAVLNAAAKVINAVKGVLSKK
jgi:hypothetical protein